MTDFADMDSWFKDATRGFIQFEERQSEVEEIKSAKYRVFDNLNSEYFSNYILPLLTLKNTRLAILSNYSTRPLSTETSAGHGLMNDLMRASRK